MGLNILLDKIKIILTKLIKLIFLLTDLLFLLVGIEENFEKRLLMVVKLNKFVTLF